MPLVRIKPLRALWATATFFVAEGWREDGRSPLLVPLGAGKVPAALAMADQGVRLVLRCQPHLTDPAIPNVGEHKIDDAVFRAEMNRWLGPFVGQLPQATSPATGKDHGVRGSCEFRNGDPT